MRIEFMTPAYLIVNLMLIQVTGPDAMPQKEVTVLMQRVERKVRRAGIRLNVRRRKAPDRTHALSSTSDYLGRFYVLEEITKKTPGEMTHVLLPPMEGKFIAGQARFESFFEGGFSVSNAKSTRPWASAQAVAHELLHQVGAEHQEGRNIMHEASLGFAEEDGKLSKILKATKREIRRFLGGNSL